MLILEEVNVLYIEDDKDNAQIILSFLKKPSYIKFNVIHKKTLEDGLNFIKKYCFGVDTYPIDIILLDLVLPNSQGVDTYKKVYKVCPNIPIVIISGHEEMACQCIKLGAQDYLVKPDITPTLIQRSLKYAIERDILEKSKIKAEREFRNLVEVTKAGIYEIDFISNKFVYVNNVICKQLGYSKEEMLNMKIEDILTKNSFEQWKKRISDLKHGEYIDSTFEYEAKRKDGGSVWALITAEYKCDENNNVVGASVVAIDITARKIAEKQAKVKQEVVFNELENKLHSWRKEILLKSEIESKKLKLMDQQISSITSGVV